MKTFVLLILAVLVCAVPALAEHGGAHGTFLVVKHICDVEIQSTNDFTAIGDAIDQEAACPTAVLPDDEFTSGIHAEQVDFDIVLQGEAGAFMTLEDATFVQASICETELNKDLNSDGAIEADTCLDMSAYQFDDVPLDNVTITESRMPSNTRFGTVGVGAGLNIISSSENGVIQLDTTNEDEERYTVHIFNFRNVDGNETNETTTTVTETTTVSETTGGANLYVKEWYPKENHFVFVCEVNGFTPTSYSWFYDDGHKLLNIHNGDTYHIFEQPGTYDVMCVATDGTNTASDTLAITVSELRETTSDSTDDFVCTPSNSITCDGQTMNVDSCQTVSCDTLCIGDVCMSNVENMQVCPSNQQRVNAADQNTQDNDVQMVTVCHEAETTLIDEATLAEHMDHGDTLGVCATNTTTNETNTTNTTGNTT